MAMKLRILGTGDAAGVPVHGCNCPACAAARDDAALMRRPCSALLECGGRRWLIDAGLMDLVERFPDSLLDGILLTHFHVDHVQGLFRLRWGVGDPLPVYCPTDSEGCADLYKHPGILRFIPVHKFEPLQLGGITVTPLPLIHSKPTLGYCFEADGQRIAYLTDTRGLPPRSLEFLCRWRPQQMIIDTRNPPSGPTTGHHNDLDDTLALHRQIAPGQTWITHLGHEMDGWLLAGGANNLPTGLGVARDNQIIGVG
jgi:phosphoribosyl 1,2-cyclic phosphate phosphodiesterase